MEVIKNVDEIMPFKQCLKVTTLISTWFTEFGVIDPCIFYLCLLGVSYSFGDHTCLVYYRWMEPLLQLLFLVRVTVKGKIPRVANQM